MITGHPGCTVASTAPATTQPDTPSNRSATASASATSDATGAQPLGVKALAKAALARNQQRNWGATSPEIEVLEARSCIVAHARQRNRATDTAPFDPAACRAELVRLVNRVGDHNGFTPEQRQEALDLALGDAQAALECFRTLAAGIPMPEPSRDDGVRCIDCDNLRAGVCQVERFSPVRDISRRCGTFKPKRVH